jgi:endonuclease-3
VRKSARAAALYEALLDAYPDAHCALNYADPYQLAVATILSAQCTDERVNLVTPALFRRFPTAQALAAAEPEEVESLIHSTGFFRNKARNLIGMAISVTERHGGELPRTMEELTRLPGIGRKTANVILGNAFGLNEGVVVDTHVSRLAGRMGFTSHSDPVRIERDLAELFPRESWTLFSHLMISHGRTVCTARRPHCEGCAVSPLCPSSTV